MAAILEPFMGFAGEKFPFFKHVIFGAKGKTELFMTL